MIAASGSDDTGSDATPSGENGTGAPSIDEDSNGLPNYVKILLAIAVLVIVFIVVLDMLVIAGSL